MDLNFDWLSENFNLGVLKYWTGYADEAECVVSSGNGWKIEREGDDNNFSLAYYNSGLSLGFTQPIEIQIHCFLPLCLQCFCSIIL